MTNQSIDEETSETILARLRLAQALLEESDTLPGRSGYAYGTERWWLHPRHEREALVVYLLLTCFDLLGQTREFLTLTDWLKSKQPKHDAERTQALAPGATNHVDAARMLADEYHRLYGVRNAFYHGIESLSQASQDRLLGSIRILVNPNVGKNVSSAGLPVEDASLERKLRLNRLYDKRNRFTHRLDQFHCASSPMLCSSEVPRGASWYAIIKNDRLYYMGVHPENWSHAGMAYSITTTEWPFVLFETLYEAIGRPFERTSIKLKFKVTIFTGTEPERYVECENVDHLLLKDFRALAKDAFART